MKATATPRVSFTIPGAQKSGTSALRYFLRQHPDIYIPEEEVHFFDQLPCDYQRHIKNEYELRFSKADPGQIVGDCTPIYLFWEDCIRRLSEYNPYIKLIILLRDPFERALSQWKMNTLRGLESLDFDDAIRAEKQRISEDCSDFSFRHFSYVSRGRYGDQISNALKFVAKEQMLFLNTSDLLNQHEESLEKICIFLGVRPFHQPPAPNIIRPKIRDAKNGPIGLDRVSKLQNRAIIEKLIVENLWSQMKMTSSLTGIEFPRFCAPLTSK